MNKLLPVVLALAASTAIQAANADDSATTQTPYDKYVSQGQKAFDHGSFKNAITYWKKALGLATGENEKAAPPVLLKLAQAVAAQKKYLDANQYLEQAKQSINQLGLALSDEFASVWNQISPHYRIVDVAIFGDSAAKALTENAAKVSLLEGDNGGSHVDIAIPARFQKTVKNDTVDEIAFEKAVSFDLSKDTAGNTIMSNIKGFRMHIPEKGLWVNLMNLVVKPADAATGNAPAEVTAGKAGISKVVASSLPPVLLTPIDALNKKATELGKPAEIQAQPTPPVEANAQPSAPSEIQTSPATPAETTAQPSAPAEVQTQPSTPAETQQVTPPSN